MRTSFVRPGWVSTVAVLIVVATTSRLGVWQLSRYQERSAIAALRTERHALPPLTLAELAEPGRDADGLPYRRVRLEGRFGETAVVAGGVPYSRNGYAVFSALHGELAAPVLVLRGWIPPDGWTAYLTRDDAPVVVEGVLQLPADTADVKPVPHPASGQLIWPLQREPFLGVLSRGTTLPVRNLARALSAEPAFYVVAGPELADLEERNTKVLPAGGYTTYLKVFHHLEYALQWFAFAAIALGLWLWYGWRRAQRSDR